MLGFGLLALMGVGVAMSMGGSGDDAVEIEDDARQDNVDDTPTEVTDEIVTGDEDTSDFGDGDADEGETDDGSSDEDSAEDGASDDEPTEEEDDEEEETTDTAAAEHSRPPMGEEYRDPLLIAEELDAQRILDEIAAEEARQPVNLVTVTNAEGAEVEDDAVLAENDDNTTGDAPTYEVTAPSGTNSISVNYDAEHTFAIEYNADTTSVTAALNSTISGPEGFPQKATNTTEDEDGNVITEVTWTNGFNGSTDIEINVTPEQLGQHVAQIDLPNSADSLNFEFSEEVSGNFHLVMVESEEGDQGDTSVTKRAFVVQTASTQDALSSAEVQAFATNGEMRGATFNVVAEIYLGNDALFASAVPEEGEDPSLWVNDFINDTPLISTNIEWASVSDLDEATDGASDVPVTDGTGQGEEFTLSPNGEDGIEGIFEDAGLNPQFFGF